MTPKQLEKYAQLQVQALSLGLTIKARKSLKTFTLLDREDHLVLSGTLEDLEIFIKGVAYAKSK